MVLGWDVMLSHLTLLVILARLVPPDNLQASTASSEGVEVRPVLHLP